MVTCRLPFTRLTVSTLLLSYEPCGRNSIHYVGLVLSWHESTSRQNHRYHCQQFTEFHFSSAHLGTTMTHKHLYKHQSHSRRRHFQKTKASYHSCWWPMLQRRL